MEWLHWSTIDWAATGTMLQGIGAIVGAAAIIVAALVGGGTFQSWRRQQIVQKHMDLAEHIVTLAVKAKYQIGVVRFPLKTRPEMEEAAKTLEANDIKEDRYDFERWQALKVSQVTHSRLNNYSDTWSDLLEIRPSAYVHFGEKIATNLDGILGIVQKIRTSADDYGRDFGNDPTFSAKLRGMISSSRSEGRQDDIGEAIATFVGEIENELQPFIRDGASETREIVKDIISKALTVGARAAFPF